MNVPPKYRQDPDEFREIVQAQHDAFRRKEISEPVYRAKLKFLGYTDAEINAEVENQKSI